MVLTMSLRSSASDTGRTKSSRVDTTPATTCQQESGLLISEELIADATRRNFSLRHHLQKHLWRTGRRRAVGALLYRDRLDSRQPEAVQVGGTTGRLHGRCRRHAGSR